MLLIKRDSASGKQLYSFSSCVAYILISVIISTLKLQCNFPAGWPSTEHVSVGCFVTEKYARSHAPEFASGKVYHPFMFGNWATVFLISKYGNIYFDSVILFDNWISASQSTIPSVDEVSMTDINIDPVHPLDAKEAKDRLGAIVHSMAPESLRQT